MKIMTIRSAASMNSLREMLRPATSRPKCSQLYLPVLLLGLLFGSAARLQADVSVFQEGVNGYTGAQDTELREAPVDANTPQGNVGNITVDNNDPAPYRTVGLMRFDNMFGPNPGQIPPGSNIISARLRIRTTNPGSAGAHAHRMLFDWSEATATWNSVACCGNLTVGIEADDVDCTTADLDGDAVPGITFPNVNVVDTFTEIDVTVDVQAWSDGTNNFGWAILANGTDGWDWPSSEATGILDYRPRLFVEWGVQRPPEFTLQPTNLTVLQARTATFTAAAIGSEPITLQWYKDDVAIDPLVNPSAATGTLTLVNAQETDEGAYYCKALNSVGETNTNPASLTVEPDVVAPTIISGLGSRSFDRVIVQFDEAMDPVTTTDGFNWGVLDSGGNPVSLDLVPVALSTDGTVATLILAPGVLLVENSLYTIQASSGILDVTGNALVDTNVVFRTFINGCNTFLFEAFDTASTPGNAVTLLTTHPNYPNNPRDLVNIPSLDSRHAYTDNAHEQFGGRVRGLFVPLVNGPHTFYLASDDAGQLFLNPAGPDAAGKQLVAEQLGCCNDFAPVPSPLRSAPINLTAGQAYYVEALFKEGTGGDWLKVAARPSGDPVPPGGNADNASVSPNVMQGGAGPAGILNHVTIASHPASQNKIAGDVAAFSVGLSIDVPGCFQWRRDGVDILGAVGPNYRLTTSLADNGAKFRCAISLMGGTTLLSDEATLNVESDTTAPTVTGVAQDVIGNITVTFSETMDLSTATNVANYLIDGTAPSLATASSSTVVVLVPSAAIAPCPASHTVTVSNVRDANQVLITPNPTAVVATLNDLLVLPINASTTWRYDESGEELGDAWYATAFDDSAWSNGVPAFGVEAAAQLPSLVPIRTPHIWTPVKLSVYYRIHFNLPTDPSSVTNLQLHHQIDDGGVFYLNGQELIRIRMPGGVVDTNILAANATETTPGTISVDSVPAGALQFGDNVLAVRVHQSSTTSSDIVFLAGVMAQTTGCVAERPRLKIERNGDQVTISLLSGPNGTIYRSSSLENPSWTAVGPAPQTLTIGPGNQFFEIRP